MTTKWSFAYELRAGEEFVARDGFWYRAARVETTGPGDASDTTTVTTKHGTVFTYNAWDSFQVS